jgi:signal transduction histidine kinase
MDRELDLTVLPVLDSSGQIFALIHILRPTRDRGEVASDPGHIEKLTNIGQIAAGMAHELNTPLGSIILATDIIAEQLPASSAITDEIARIRAQADHCSKVVGQLLSYVRKDEQVRSVHDVREVIERVLELVAAEATKQRITLDLESTPDKPAILCNENQIEQLFFNLLSNAFHAVGPDGSISIQIGYDPLLEQVTVSIADNGVGIPQEQIDKIFEPFFTTKSSKEGTGLGLALCRKIMVEHGGRITVESKIGDGTTFKLYFPTAQ